MNIFVWIREDPIGLLLALGLQNWEECDEEAHPTVNNQTHFAPKIQKALQVPPGTLLVED